MKTTIFKSYYFIFFFLLTSSFSYSQVFDFYGNYVIQPEEDYYKGKIMLKSNDTVIGAISLNYRVNDNFVALLDDGSQEIKIPNEDIIKIVLEDKDNSLTEFESIENSKLFYRILHSGNVKIYDSSSKPRNGSLVSGVFVVENNKTHNLFDFWSSGPKQDLITYINKKNNQNFKKRDFKNVDEIFAYIDK
jgi:hypothetical protein